MGGVPETHASSSSLDHGRSLHFVASEQPKGQPVPRPGPTIARGRWTDGRGRMRRVEACEEHAGGVER